MAQQLTTLIATALAQGLILSADGDELVIRGPRRCESLALELIAHKAEVLPLLRPRRCGRLQLLLAGLQRFHR